MRELLIVPEERLELSQVAPLAPKASASANSATPAYLRIYRKTKEKTIQQGKTLAALHTFTQ